MSRFNASLTFSTIGDGLTSAMSPESSPIKMRGGRARSIFELTKTNLAARASYLRVGTGGIEKALEEADAAFEKGLDLCESPIECMVLASLITADWAGFKTVPPIVHDSKKEPFIPRGDIVIVPQFAFIKYRFDFAIVGRRGLENHIIAIECDGADYHDAAKDRDRDRYLLSWGIKTFRISGKNISRDIVPCIEAAVLHMGEWACTRDMPENTVADT